MRIGLISVLTLAGVALVAACGGGEATPTSTQRPPGHPYGFSATYRYGGRGARGGGRAGGGHAHRNRHAHPYCNLSPYANL